MSALMKSQDDFSKKDQNGSKQANFKTINSVSASQNVEKGTFAK